MTVRLILQKSDNPVSIASDSLKDFGLFAIIKAMQAGFTGILKQVFSWITFLPTTDLTEIFHSASVGSPLKSTI